MHLFFLVAPFLMHGGTRTLAPVHRCTTGSWVWTSPPPPLPLYGDTSTFEIYGDSASSEIRTMYELMTQINMKLNRHEAGAANAWGVSSRSYAPDSPVSDFKRKRGDFVATLPHQNKAHQDNVIAMGPLSRENFFRRSDDGCQKP